jgi:hypothetical protein
VTPRRTALYFLLGTAAFLALDLLLGAPIRVAALPTLSARLGYYAGLAALGVLAIRLPLLAPWLAAGESVVNLFLLFLSILLPLWSLPEVVAAGGEPTPPVTGWGILNLILVGGVLVASFHGGLRRAAGSTAPMGPGGPGAAR